MSDANAPVTSKTIPGTNVPDVTQAQAESDRHKKWMQAVAAVTAVLATLASLAAMFAGDHMTKAMLEQIRTADQWSFYQAKGLKLALQQNRVELLPALGKTVSDDDTARINRYGQEQQSIKKDAEKAQAQASDHRRRNGLFTLACTAFQVGIALSAVALLVRRNWLFVGAILMGVLGTAVFTYAFVSPTPPPVETAGLCVPHSTRWSSQTFA